MYDLSNSITHIIILLRLNRIDCFFKVQIYMAIFICLLKIILLNYFMQERIHVIVLLDNYFLLHFDNLPLIFQFFQSY